MEIEKVEILVKGKWERGIEFCMKVCVVVKLV